MLIASNTCRAFETASHGSRKVIIATNIAETSVTIEGVKFVVDAGLVKMKFFNVVSGIDALITCPVAKSSANQRAGRAGRTAPGKCYRLLTEQSFTGLDPFNTPEMQRTDITWAVLQLKALGIDDVIHFDFLSSPYLESLNYSLELLYSLGALDLDCKLTDIGEKMSGVCLYCVCSYCMCSYCVCVCCMCSYCMYLYCMDLFVIFTADLQSLAVQEEQCLQHNIFVSRRDSYDSNPPSYP